MPVAPIPPMPKTLLHTPAAVAMAFEQLKGESTFEQILNKIDEVSPGLRDRVKHTTVVKAISRSLCSDRIEFKRHFNPQVGWGSDWPSPKRPGKDGMPKLAIRAIVRLAEVGEVIAYPEIVECMDRLDPEAKTELSPDCFNFGIARAFERQILIAYLK